MHISKKILAPMMGAIITLTLGVAGAASALTASCSGVAAASNVTWTASTSGGVAPIAFSWGNGATTSTQVVAEPSYGTYTMNLQATDASSSVATSTCSATVAQPAPTISSFTATPSTISAGQSSVLSWNVSNASSTSINNGLGTISSTSITVTPSVTTTYTLTATNPGGSSTANVTLTVGTSSSSTDGSDVVAKIQALLAQIAALKAQIAQLIIANIGGSGSSATSTAQCFNFGRDLHEGDEGDDVKSLQHFLSEDSRIFSPALVTGHFGHKTREALRLFQAKFGISSSSAGFFGEKSRKFFKENCGQHEGQDNDDNDQREHEHHGTSTQSLIASSTNPFWNWGHREEREHEHEHEHENKGGKHGHDD